MLDLGSVSEENIGTKRVNLMYFQPVKTQFVLTYRTFMTFYTLFEHQRKSNYVCWCVCKQNSIKTFDKHPFPVI